MKTAKTLRVRVRVCILTKEEAQLPHMKRAMLFLTTLPLGELVSS